MQPPNVESRLRLSKEIPIIHSNGVSPFVGIPDRSGRSEL